MKRGIAFAVLILLALAAGCGRPKQVKVTFRSDPPGGTLYKQNGELWGACPKVLWYSIDGDAYENGYLDAKGLVVRWPTGPEVRTDDLLRITVDGTDRKVVFFQPIEAPKVKSAQSSI